METNRLTKIILRAFGEGGDTHDATTNQEKAAALLELKTSFVLLLLHALTPYHRIFGTSSYLKSNVDVTNRIKENKEMKVNQGIKANQSVKVNARANHVIKLKPKPVKIDFDKPKLQITTRHVMNCQHEVGTHHHPSIPASN